MLNSCDLLLGGDLASTRLPKNCIAFTTLYTLSICAISSDYSLFCQLCISSGGCVYGTSLDGVFPACFLACCPIYASHFIISDLSHGNCNISTTSSCVIQILCATRLQTILLELQITLPNSIRQVT